ncbi:LuxR C-terminal-related transcriptional regulator [Serratia fonticola]|uniref:LuxR C-terminal-related transcriptional regulator n=1 Tax=Serratia fonticola TaxID=47917 RepID=UPI0021B8418C|nr:LuxR C-terminal-related transcriptional regulator [Serratia fonticola]
MIYVISEDNYFSIGLMAMFDYQEISATLINIDSFYDFDIGKQDIILLCTHSRANSQMINQLVFNSNSRIIYFVDEDIDKLTFRLNGKSVISKKLSGEQAIAAINNIYVNNRYSSNISLSQKETLVMNLLVKQKNAHSIAKMLNISMKTVFAHKLNALHKMGFGHLNACSVLLYERVFQDRFEYEQIKRKLPYYIE